jgi:hypothetical protein
LFHASIPYLEELSIYLKWDNNFRLRQIFVSRVVRSRNTNSRSLEVSTFFALAKDKSSLFLNQPRTRQR